MASYRSRAAGAYPGAPLRLAAAQSSSSSVMARSPRENPADERGRRNKCPARSTVGSDAGEEQQRRWMILTIQGNTDSVAFIESRQLAPASEYGHMDRLTLEARP